jgi:hypothetical protein
MTRAVLFGPPAALVSFLIELHLILRWFYSSKPFPVRVNIKLRLAAVIIFILSLAMTVIVTGNLYYGILGQFPGIRYLAFLSITGILIAMAVFSGRLILPDKGGSHIRRVNILNLITFYVIPVGLAVFAFNKEVFIKLSGPVNTQIHNLIYIPEILLPLALMISVMIFNASGSYLGYRIAAELPNSRFGRENGRENIDFDANPFTGME